MALKSQVKWPRRSLNFTDDTPHIALQEAVLTKKIEYSYAKQWQSDQQYGNGQGQYTMS